MNPLVTVICLCHNQGAFVEEALKSVFDQSYSPIQLIVIDDASTDDSVSKIEAFIKNNDTIQFIDNKSNLGNCRSFNIGLAYAKGEFIIDLAADDVMTTHRIEKQVQAFLSIDSSYGVVYSDVVNIDENGKRLEIKSGNDTLNPSGEIYSDLVQRYFISPPSMMMKTSVLKELGGYDETLAYEDFDFWIRSSRNYKYHYLNESLTLRRVLRKSHSSKFYVKNNNPMMSTTYRVIEKTLWLNKTKEENEAVAKRMQYELRHAFYLQNQEYVRKYFNLLKGMGSVDRLSMLFSKLIKLHLPIFYLYKLYLKFKK